MKELTPEKLNELLDSFTKQPEEDRTAAIQAIIHGIAGNLTLKTVFCDVLTDIADNRTMSSAINLLSLIFIMGQQFEAEKQQQSNASYNMFACQLQNQLSAADEDFLKKLKISLDTPAELS